MKSMNGRKMGGAASAGFTIVELVVVILLLGILTATALPRFLDISDDAHRAVVEAHVGSLGTAAALFRASWYAKGQPAAALVDYSGTASTADDLFASAAGYPAGNLDVATGGAGIPFVESHAECEAIFDNLIQDGGTSLTTGVVSTATAGVAATLATAPAGAILDGTNAWVPAADGDFAVQWVDDDGTADAAASACDYYYMGQFQTTGSLVRVIRFVPATGAVSILTSAALSAAL